MKNLLLTTIFTWVIVVINLIGTKIQAKDNSLPDSLITADYVYEYTFSDFDKALQIMGKLRKRNSLPGFKLDITESDLYFNTGKYYQALKFYGRALQSDSIQADDQQNMEQIHRMISCYDCLHNETKKAQYVEMLLKKSKQCGNEAIQSVALFNMGKMLYYQGNKEKGYEFMLQSVELMEKTDYKYKYDNLRYDYNTLLIFQERDGRNNEALQTLEALQKVVVAETGEETPMEELGEKEKKAMYAHYAVVLSRLGRLKEADGYYKQFLSLSNVFDRDNYLIMPYLLDRKMYDDVILMNSAREKSLRAQGDTTTYHMTSIKSSLGEAYKRKGDYLTAAEYFQQLAMLKDSIKNREQKSSALELATIYETHEKDLFIQQQTADIRMRNALLIFVGCIVFLSAVFLWSTIRYNRAIRRKNEAMVGTIEDLLAYREELYRRKEENFILKAQLQAEDKPQTTPKENEDVSTIETDITIENASANMPSDKDEDNKNMLYDKSMFDRVEREIINRQLFLQPDFSREELIKIIYIPKNKFAQLFKLYARTSFSKYVNNLRLEYAAGMLKEHPYYTIDAIAKECGMSTVQTFYRLFSEKFGVTPTEFRSGLKIPENECNND